MIEMRDGNYLMQGWPNGDKKLRMEIIITKKINEGNTEGCNFESI
jgi:hypothetical protein